ncbi:DUF1394-domain-containing protein [Neoconidiobolus thromboides FSU 785]|nr:DUF1394-domain-containing protein [Neoconidiobolus thromboides FSU 785]
MGALFSSLKSSSSEITPINLKVNLTNPTPNSNENSHANITEFLDTSNGLLEKFKKYKGCSEEIRQAISFPTDENHLIAWSALQDPINLTVKLYRYSLSLEKSLVELLEFLCQNNNIHGSLEENQYSTKLLLDALGYAFKFDELKTKNSDIQNDFSFYRRSISKFKMMEKGLKETDLTISDEEANHLSLFLAHHTPMFNTVSQTIKALVAKNPPIQGKLEKLFSGLVGISYHKISEPSTDSELRENLLRALVSSTILYDNLRPEGMFAKGTTCDIKSIVKTIQGHGGRNTEHLMNGLRFNLVHLNDKVTPKHARALLGVN